MGREIRMVPPHWDHPIMADGQYQPMLDETYESASAKWIAEFLDWHVKKAYPDYASPEDRAMPYWDWENMPPDKAYYRTYSDAEATWFQVFETVTEGTPVTPPFATKEELIEYLAKNGDFWDQERARTGRLQTAGWGRESAEKFVDEGFAFTLMRVGGQVFEGGRDSALASMF
jgi:hypothetical protein